MKLDIDKASDVPVRQQIVRQIVFGIATGRLEAGAPLPSVRELAMRHKIHPNTVSQAYQELVAEHWIKRQRGRRMLVRLPHEGLVERDEDIDDLINETIRTTRARGYSMQELRGRVQERLLLEPPDHVLVVEREPGLLRLLESELEEFFPKRLDACLVEDVARNPGRAISALVVCLPGVVWHVAPIVGRQRAVLLLQLPDVDEQKALVQQLGQPSVIAFVSVSPYCLSIAKGLFAGVVGSRHTMETYCVSEGESRDLSGADVVFSDCLAARQIHAASVYPYRFVSAATVAEIEASLGGAGTAQNSPRLRGSTKTGRREHRTGQTGAT